MARVCNWTTLTVGLVLGWPMMALAQGQSVQPADPPQAVSPGTPAEIQPGHEAGGPQTAKPAPLPPGSGADTPGGSARHGVISPPGVNDPGIEKGVPPAGTNDKAVVPPSGATPGVVPK